jgi:hypothetical protein
MKWGLILLSLTIFLVMTQYEAYAIVDGSQGSGNSEIIYSSSSNQPANRPSKPEPQKKLPFEVVGPQISDPYGNWIGDHTEIVYIVTFEPGILSDFSLLPKTEEKVGDYIVRKSDISQATLSDGRKEFTIRFIVQNFAVVCSPQYVPFGKKLAILWKKEGEVSWQELVLPPAKVLISNISRCDEKPDISLSPREMMNLPEIRKYITRLFIVSGVGLILLGVLFSFGALRKFYFRYELSPLWRARRALLVKDIDSFRALHIFRNAMHQKFGISAAYSGREVFEKLSESSLWKEFAQDAASLWEETTYILYANHLPDESLTARIRSFINKLCRREVDE